MTYIVSFDSEDYWLGQFVPYQNLYIIEWSGWSFSASFSPHSFNVTMDHPITIEKALKMRNNGDQQAYLVSSLDPFRNATSYEDFISIFRELYPEYSI